MKRIYYIGIWYISDYIYIYASKYKGFVTPT